MNRQLILLELNEVPDRVLDAYCAWRPQSTLARILSRSARYRTVTEDQLALDPWISWPTLHRGVPDRVHHILHLGQVLDEVDREYPPIWRSLKQHGLRVGVFGSLHSSSIPADAREYSFYLPDYFQADVFAHPHSLKAFQELNLAMTRQSARNVTRSVPLRQLFGFAASLPTSGVTLATALDTTAHLLRELRDPGLRIRRRAYQPLFMADMFMRQLKRSQPHFATFYTNHVAAAMHRYWAAAFPGDYANRLDAEWTSRYSTEIAFAMDKFDTILARVVAAVDANPQCRLVIASSMGQAAIPATQTYEFLTITELPRFMAALGVPADGWEPRPAMVPCWCVVVQDRYRDQVVAGLQQLNIGSAQMRADTRPVAPMSYDERQRGFFQFFVQFDNYQGAQLATLDGRKVPFAEMGIGMMAHEDGVNCTAQHVPEGSLLVYGGGKQAAANASAAGAISTVDVAPSILHYFSLAQPGYMKGTPSITLH